MVQELTTESFLLLKNLRPSRTESVNQSLLIAAVIFAAVAHRLYHSNSLLLFGLSPCIWGALSQREPSESSALAFDSLRI